jgi:hypothetical protein
MNKLKTMLGVVATSAVAAWSPAQADVVTQWNAITVNCVQGPHTPANRAGPAGLLDIALVQAAVHDAVQAIQGRFKPYEYANPKRRGKGSADAAAAAAAHGVLVGLYGADDACLTTVSDPAMTYAGDNGLQAGMEAAAAMLPHYRPSFVLPTDPFLGGTAAGEWRPTPGVTQGAATFLAQTAPFALSHAAQFRPAPPPRLTSGRYRADYEEVKNLGSLLNSTRTPEQTELARFWTANYFVQWNETLRGIADKHLTDIGDKARLLALTSFAAADSQISVYETYHYNFWRPITAIQNGDNDSNPTTVGDVAWLPLITTPPYPDYSSGANCLVAAITTVLRNFFGTDELDFSVKSSAAGLTTNPRGYTRISHVMQEVVDARIYQGIHFRFADDVDRWQGARIGRCTYKHYLQPEQCKD